MDKSRKMEEDCGQRWTMWFLWKEVIKLSDTHCRLSAEFWEQAVFSWVQNFSSGKETAQVAVNSGNTATLRNDSMKSSTNFHVDSSDV
jgi:hypothetical protein